MCTTTHTATPFWRYRKLIQIHPDILLYIAYHYPYSYTILKVQNARSNTPWYTTIHHLPLPTQLHHSEGTESSFKYTLIYYYTSPTTTHTATPFWRYRELIQIHWHTTIHHLPLPTQLHHSEGTESSFKYTDILLYIAYHYPYIYTTEGSESSF